MQDHRGEVASENIWSVALSKVAGRTKLKFEELTTHFINCRPITFIYVDQEGISHLSHRSTFSMGTGLLLLEMQLTLKLLAQTNHSPRELRTRNIVWLS